MCGRFTLKTPPEEWVKAFGLEQRPNLPPRYNIAPTQAVAAVRVKPGNGARELAALRWGLVPAWAEDPRIGARMINARAESVAAKAAFRAAFRRRRCLIPSDGFYEWQRTRGKRQPFYVRLGAGAVFAFAGLWERWQGAGDEVRESCAIITTEANEVVAPIHDRMPVILKPDDYGPWLEPAGLDREAGQALLGPYPAQDMVAYPVGLRVNSPKDDDATCIASLKEADALPFGATPPAGGADA
ncbi:MAG: SOS response-associated peptidase [Alphaproteobacteria bacterium]